MYIHIYVLSSVNDVDDDDDDGDDHGDEISPPENRKEREGRKRLTY